MSKQETRLSPWVETLLTWWAALCIILFVATWFVEDFWAALRLAGIAYFGIALVFIVIDKWILEYREVRARNDYIRQWTDQQ